MFDVVQAGAEARGLSVESPTARRVVIAGNEVLHRECHASLLERAGFDVAGRASDPRQLVDLVDSCRPELVLVDIGMLRAQATAELDAECQVRSVVRDLAIVVLAACIEVDQAIELLDGGGRTGNLLKNRITGWTLRRHA